MSYTGRFAPSPTGPLHAGSLVAALASWLDARAHGGRWLVRIEDVDAPRCLAGTDDFILRQLAQCGLVSDETPIQQSRRSSAYGTALQHLAQAGLAYPCTCSRKAIEQALLARGWQASRHGERPYPGTCRPPKRLANERRRTEPAPAALSVSEAGVGFAWRLRTEPLDAGLTEEDNWVHWLDRRLGNQCQNLSRSVGDFVLRRADGWWAYQLAVVVDDAHQGVTHVVRGDDLADNTPRQIHLQDCLGLPRVCYLHTPLVMAADGQKLSKQNGALALDLSQPLRALQAAAEVLGLPTSITPPPPTMLLADWLASSVQAWRERWVKGSPSDLVA